MRDMSKTSIVAKHEFLTTIRRKAFILLTLALPAVALSGIFIAQVMTGLSQPPAEVSTIGYVDQVGTFTDVTASNQIKMVRYATPVEAQQALLGQVVKEYIVIPADYVSTGVVQRFTTNRELSPDDHTIAVVREFLLGNLLRGSADPRIIERVKIPLNLISTQLTPEGNIAPNQGGAAAFIVPYIFSLLLIMSIFTSSGYLLQGLGEEKENRVMEVLLSSVSPRQLLAGKVMGLGAAGLVQVVVWLITARFTAGFVSSTWGAVIGTLQVPADFLILGIVYFILGYLLFAVLMAGAGAVSPNAREAQQLSTIFTMVGVAPLFFLQFLIENPNHVFAQVLTLIPITAPITIMIRYGLTAIPLWQLAASIGLMVLFITGSFLLCARLFRTYLLMYGKRPDVKDILRSFKTAK